MKIRAACGSLALAVLVLAGRSEAQTADVPGCVPASEVTAEQMARLNRFAVLPDGLEKWRSRDCYPRSVTDDVLVGMAAPPVGAIVGVAGKDAVVVDPGSAWLDHCAASGLLSAGVDPVTGSDFASIKQWVVSTPGLAAADVREIGFSRGHTRDGRPLYALSVGNLKRSVLVECEEDLRALFDRAAQALGPP